MSVAMRSAILNIVVAAAAAAPRPALGQADSLSSEFLARTRVAASRYLDPRDAMAAGYRPVGPEVPAMGQHWIQPSLLVAGRLDPLAPQVLEYTTIGGHPVLVGVAYAILLGPGESPPDVPVGHLQWHAHAGEVNEEALADSHAESGDSLEDRVAVLHAWVPVDNPAGPFQAENWSLPFLRAGLYAPPDAPAASAEAIALGSGWASYFEEQFRRKLRPDSANEARAMEFYAAFADSVGRWRRARTGSDTITTRDVLWLAGLWGRLQGCLAATLAPDKPKWKGIVVGH